MPAAAKQAARALHDRVHSHLMGRSLADMLPPDALAELQELARQVAAPKLCGAVQCPACERRPTVRACLPASIEGRLRTAVL